MALKPFEFSNPYVFGWQHNGAIGAAVMRCPPGSELMTRCYDAVVAMDQRFNWGEAGPKLLTKLARANGLERFALPMKTFYPIPFPDWRRLFSDDECAEANEASAIHFWHELMRRDGMSRYPRGSRNSMFERLVGSHFGDVRARQSGAQVLWETTWRWLELAQRRLASASRRGTA